MVCSVECLFPKPTFEEIPLEPTVEDRSSAATRIEPDIKFVEQSKVDTVDKNGMKWVEYRITKEDHNPSPTKTPVIVVTYQIPEAQVDRTKIFLAAVYNYKKWPSKINVESSTICGLVTSTTLENRIVVGAMSASPQYGTGTFLNTLLSPTDKQMIA